MTTEAKTNETHLGLPIPSGNAHHNSRTRRHLAAKIAALILVLTILVHTYRPQWHPPYRLKSDNVSPVPQDNNILPDPHIGVIFPVSNATISLQNRPKVQYQSCKSVNVVSTDRLHYNITDQFHFLDTSIPSLNKKVRGTVNVYRGNIDQASDVVVTVITHYAFSPSNPIIRWYSEPNSTARLHYTSTECTEVEVLISLRPDTEKNLRTFELRTEILDINVGGSLSWMVDNFITQTSHGNTMFDGARFYEPMITHNVSSSSITGEIFGYYVADAHLRLANEKGRIRAFVIPRVNSDIAIALESIRVETETGDVHVEMLGDWALWPMQPFMHTTHISSQCGSVWAAIPHGSLTNITIVTGDVSAILVPFGTDSKEDKSWVHTWLTQGEMYVHIYNTLQDSLYDGKFDPLVNTRSRHKVINGNLVLRYPYNWYGELEGVASRGTLKFDASRLEKLERGEGWVKAKRGDGESFMESWVEGGGLDIKIGLGA
jgi:hypothetical protein